jgi:hypothetical protein
MSIEKAGTHGTACPKFPSTALRTFIAWGQVWRRLHSFFTRFNSLLAHDYCKNENLSVAPPSAGTVQSDELDMCGVSNQK